MEGNDLYTTIRPGAQRIALNALGGRCGAAVALEPRTGKVLVSVSSPTYDPNLIENDFPAAARPRFGCQPLLNRVTAGLYAPGSIFKVVTGAAALDAGEFTPESTFNDPGYCEEYGKRVENYDTSSPFGNVNLVEAMQYSINSVFCNIGKAIGGIKILQTAKKFGFYSVPPLETPGQRALGERSLRQGPPLLPEGRHPGRPRPPRLRAGADAGHPAADGHGHRSDRERRARDEATRRRSHRGSGRHGRRPAEARRARGSRPARPCAVDRRDDGARRLLRDRNRREALGADGRQDRNGRDRGRRAAIPRGSSPSPRSRTRGSPWRSFSSVRAARAAPRQPPSPARSCRH